MSAKSSKLPQVPSLDANIIPVVCLLHLTTSTLKKLRNSLSTADSKWRESPPISTPNLSYIDWTRDEEGTCSDIYVIASQAAKTGHSSLIFLDGKSARDGSALVARRLEYGELSIRRMRANRAALSLKFCAENGLPCSDAPRGKFEDHQIGSFFNPFGRPFSDDGVGNREGSQESEVDISTLTAIPPEIETKQDRPIIISLTAGATVEDFLSNVQRRKKKGTIPVDQIDFHPWTGPLDGTRADLHRIFHRTKFHHAWGRRSNIMPISPKLFFIKGLPSAEDTSSKSSSAIIYAHDQGNSSTIKITGLATEHLKRAWAKICGFYETQLVFDDRLVDGCELENIVDPNGYMYRKDQPPWLPDDLQNTIVPAVFYLVKLSSEEEKTLRKELATFTDIELGLLEDGCMDEEKNYLYIPWNNDIDGTDIDMVRISKDTGLGNAVFVDRRSAKDNSVILTDTHAIYDKDETGKEIFDAEHKKIIGVDWGRTAGKEARLSWINLNIANMLLTEVVDGAEPEFLSFGLLDREEVEEAGGKGYNFRESTKRAAEHHDEQTGPETKVAKT